MSEKDEQITSNEFMIALPSMMIGVAVLSLPTNLAKVTLFADGWIVIVGGGILFILFASLATKLTMMFPGEEFYTYTSYLVGKPVALLFTFINACIGLFLSSFSVRSVAYISQQSFFEQTPMEVLALGFLLIVVYAVANSRIGIFRLNILFFPIILMSFIIIGIFNIKWFELSNLLPLFKTKPRDYWQGLMKTYDVFVGFGIILFYAYIIKPTKQLPKKVIIGISISTLFYIILFIITIGVFGNTVTGHMSYPMIELAKRVDIPGGILERIDAVFFSIWMMTIFNTVAMAFDVAVQLLHSMFKRMDKKTIIFLLSPLVYYLAMFPQQVNQVQMIAKIASQTIVYFTFFVISGLFIMAKWKGVHEYEKK